MESGKEVIHYSQHIPSLNEDLFGTVLLLPTPENFVGSIAIITKFDQKSDNQDDNMLQLMELIQN